MPPTRFFWKILYILVIGEYVSRYVETVAMPDQTADTVAQAFLEKIILRFGCPSNMLTDQSSNFQSDLFEKVYSILGIPKLRTAAYTPRTNGFVEKMNRLLIDSLTIFVHNNATDWCTYLPYVTYSYNISHNPSINNSPHFVLFGSDPVEPPNLVPPRYRLFENIMDIFTYNWHRAIEHARETLSAKQVYQKAYYDRNSKPIHFKVGQNVLLKELKPQTGKFYFRWDGPYEITKAIPPKNFVIRRAFTSHELFVNADRLKSFVPRQTISEISLDTAVENPIMEQPQSETSIHKSNLSNNQPILSNNSHLPTNDANKFLVQSNNNATQGITKRTRGRPRKAIKIPTQSPTIPQTPILPTRQLRQRINLPVRLADPDILLKY